MAAAAGARVWLLKSYRSLQIEEEDYGDCAVLEGGKLQGSGRMTLRNWASVHRRFADFTVGKKDKVAMMRASIGYESDSVTI
uniref:Uncharacterized protein n=1 Tax=Oryza barthii TaxID=65489 RepID=A0A0D3FTY2_9ORYZ